VFFANRLSSSILRLLVPIAATLVIFLGVYIAFPTQPPDSMALRVAVVAGMVHLPFWMRTRRQPARRRMGMAALIITVIPTSGLGVMLLNGWSLAGVARMFHANEFVRQVAAIDLNGLEVDAEQGVLFANGHGTNHLLVYDMQALNKPPRQSEAELGWAQGMFYNRPEREVYIFNTEKRSLLMLDAKTLALKKSISGLNLSEGDCFIAMDRRSDTIIIASEAGYPARRPGDNDGPGAGPIVMVERTTGKQMYAPRDCDGSFCNPGHILLNEKTSLMYMGFIDGILAYNTETHLITARTHDRYHWIGDHLALTPDQSEVLYPYPLHGAVFRFDAQTLDFKGSISTVFGVRNATVDPVRNLLLTVSGFNNMLDVIDLHSRKRLAQYYIAPWLRTIALDVKTGTAYVSSVGGLYSVNYTARLPR
jgi:hypothetical protein